jgi:hypothetical protein
MKEKRDFGPPLCAQEFNRKIQTNRIQRHRNAIVVVGVMALHARRQVHLRQRRQLPFQLSATSAA